MPRYFFDTDDGFHHPDENGQMLPNVRAARLEAITAAIGLMADIEPEGDSAEFSCNVRDLSGRIVYTAAVTFIGMWAEGAAPETAEREEDPSRHQALRSADED
jgi:hypothetical protein